MVHLLAACGDELTRENLMYQATHMDHVHVPMLLPGITFDTSPTDYSPAKQMQLRRFDGTRWVGFDSIVNGWPAAPPTVAGPAIGAMALRRGQAVVAEHLPELDLQHFAGGAMRHLRQEDDIVGQLPSRDLALEKLSDRLGR